MSSFTIKLPHGDGSDTVATEWHGFIDKGRIYPKINMVGMIDPLPFETWV